MSAPGSGVFASSCPPLPTKARLARLPWVCTPPCSSFAQLTTCAFEPLRMFRTTYLQFLLVLSPQLKKLSPLVRSSFRQIPWQPRGISQFPPCVLVTSLASSTSLLTCYPHAACAVSKLGSNQATDLVVLRCITPSYGRPVVQKPS